MSNQRNATLVATFALLVGVSGCKKSSDELQQQAAALAAEPVTVESTEKAIAEAKANAEEQLEKAEAEAQQAEAEAKKALEGAADGAQGGKAGNDTSDELAGDPSGSGEKKSLVPTPPKTVSPSPPPKTVSPTPPPKTAPVEEKKGLVPSPPKTDQPKADPPTAEDPKTDPPAETAPTPKRRSFQDRKGVSKKRLPTSE